MAKTIVVAIHGILTRKSDLMDWEEDFGRWLAINQPEIQYVKFKYGWIGPVRSWLSTIMDVLRLPDWINNLATDKFTQLLTQLRKENPDAKIHIVAHSYGTWVTWNTLLDNPWIEIQSVTLVAGVISAHIEKNRLDELLGEQVKATFVWCSHDDEVVRLIAIPPFGHCGYWGCIRKDYPADRVFPLVKPYPQLELYNRLTSYEHDGYFIGDTFREMMQDIEYSESLT